MYMQPPDATPSQVKKWRISNTPEGIFLPCHQNATVLISAIIHLFFPLGNSFNGSSPGTTRNFWCTSVDHLYRPTHAHLLVVSTASPTPETVSHVGSRSPSILQRP
jgi:hypothetical protein